MLFLLAKKFDVRGMLRVLGSFGPCSAVYLDIPGMLIAGPERPRRSAHVAKL